MARSLSIKTRLVMMFVLLLVAALAATAGLTFHLTRSHLDRSLDRSLLASARSFEAGPGRDRTGDLAARAEEWLGQQAVDRKGAIAVRVAQDRVIATTSDLELSDIAGSRALLTARRPTMTVAQGPEGPVRVLAVPLTQNGGYAGTFVAVAPRSGVDETLAALIAGIGWAGAAGLLLVVAIAIVLVTAALRPLERIAASAAEIERTGDLSQRVSAGMRDDEVGRLAHAFDSMLDRLQRSFSRQQSFLSDAAHEIRTPLTVARGQLEWLQDSLTSPDEKRTLAEAVEEIDRVDSTVEDMLLLARLDEGARIVTEPVDADLVISESALRAMTMSGRTIEIQEGSGIRVLADARRLMQILDNLVGNALKYAGDDATISMSTRLDRGAGVIEVRDDGRGIPPEELERIFDRHYRVSATRNVPGAGLGLAIVRSLAEAMGGSISVRSKPGEGTTFSLRLEAAPDQQQRRSRPAERRDVRRSG